MRARALLAAMFGMALQIGLSGCSGGGDSPTGPVTQPPKPVVPVLLSVEGPNPMTEGTSVRFALSVKMSDSTTNSVQSSNWTSSNVAVATVDNGVVTAITPGTTTLTVSFGSLTGSLLLTVKSSRPTWDQWPWVSAPSREFIQANMLQAHGGGATRWQGTVRVWAQAGFKKEDLEWGFVFWKEVVHQNRVPVTFVLVGDSLSAQIRVVWDATIPSTWGECALGAPVRSFENVFLEAIIRVAPVSVRPECNWGDQIKILLAHELGHTLGIPHTPGCNDIMGGVLTGTTHACFKPQTSSLLSEVSIWNGTVDPGTNPQPVQQGNTAGRWVSR